MRHNIIKLILILCISINIQVFSFLSVYAADGFGGDRDGDLCLRNPNTPECNSFFEQNCNDPSSSLYTSKVCTERKLGLSEIQTDSIFIPRDPNSLIIVILRILIAIVIIITTSRIVIIGMQITGAGDSADKRKELFTQLIYTLIGLVIGISALGITYFVQTLFFGSNFDDQIFKCSDLPPNASQELKDKCRQYVPDTGTPTPTPIRKRSPLPTVIAE